MEFFNELLDKLKGNKDTTSMERFDRSKTRAALDSMCAEYLQTGDDVLTFEALPNAISDVIAVLDEPVFADKYSYVQVSETLFNIRMRELNLGF